MCYPASRFTAHSSSHLFVMVWRVLADITQYLSPPLTSESMSPTHLCRLYSLSLQYTTYNLKHVSSQNAIVLLFLTFPLILPNFEPSQHTKSTKKILFLSFSPRFEHGLLRTDAIHINLHLFALNVPPPTRKTSRKRMF